METKFDVGETVRFEGKIDKIVTEQLNPRTVTLYYLEGISDAFTESDLIKLDEAEEDKTEKVREIIKELTEELKKACQRNGMEV